MAERAGGKMHMHACDKANYRALLQTPARPVKAGKARARQLVPLDLEFIYAQISYKANGDGDSDSDR